MPKKLSYDYVKEYIESYGYVLLGDYIDANSKLILQCSKGHIFLMSYNSIKQGRRCSVCFGKFKYEYSYVKKYFNNEGYTLLSDTYINNKSYLNVICPNGHQYNVIFDSFKNHGKRCKECSNNTSKGEKQVAQFVKSLGVNVIENGRSQIINPLTGYNLELDVWMPELNKAIEYNGSYWHQFSSTDETKKRECKKLNIDLLIIGDDNWNNNQLIEQKIIQNFIGGN